MAVVPSNANLTTWLGTGAATTTPASATPGYYIPRANVQAYIGNDALITDDIRDFLFSVLSKCAETYNTPKVAADTRPTKVTVTRALDTLSNPKKAIFTVIIETATVTETPVTATLPTYS